MVTASPVAQSSWICVCTKSPPTSPFTITDPSPSKAAVDFDDDGDVMQQNNDTINIDSIDGSKSVDNNVISDDEQTDMVVAYHTFYGPGELETYRHTQLQQSVKEAKLKVWYPGRWHRPSPHAYFRVRLGDGGSLVQQLWKEQGNDESLHDNILLKLCSNARIVSAAVVIGAEEQLDCKSSDRDVQGDKESNAEMVKLRWQSSIKIVRDERVYDHILLLDNNIDSKNTIQTTEKDSSSECFSELILELDTRSSSFGTPDDDDDPKDNNQLDSEEIEEGGVQHDESAINAETDLDTSIDPPPCITLQVSTSTFKHVNHCDQHQQNWEVHWKPYKDKEWVPIAYCWSRQDIHDLRSIETPISLQDTTDTIDNNCTSSCMFPHQIDLHQVSTVHPINIIPSTDDCVVGTERHKSIVYDFGKELLGKVQISIPASSACAKSSTTVKLRVGETLEEAMNDEEEHFEQCLDLIYCTEDDTSATSYHDSVERHTARDDETDVQQTNLKSKHVWTSCHILAFRYARVIIPIGYVADSVTVTCELYLPLINQCGSFYCDNSTSNAGEATQPNGAHGLDEQIWQCSAYTLQCCVYNNFIVDGKYLEMPEILSLQQSYLPHTSCLFPLGIKRDRLPWVGDLAVSLMALCYSLDDEECIRWTLAVLGRCGQSCLGNKDQYKENDSDGTVTISDSHINGAVDYSLWFVISHWLYQRYFGDVTFLKQEWKLIELRMKCLVQHCSDQEKGWFKVNENDWVFIDWTVDGEKSPALQILWWYALDCMILLAQNLASLVEEAGQQQSITDSIALFASVQSKLEDSYIEMDDIQLGFTRHAHIFGVCKFHCYCTKYMSAMACTYSLCCFAFFISIWPVHQT